MTLPPAFAKHRDTPSRTNHRPNEGYSLYPNSCSSNCELSVMSPYRAREYGRSEETKKFSDEVVVVDVKSSISSAGGTERSHEVANPLL